MKPYPSINYWSQKTVGPVYVFDKIDGSSVRCEINRKGEISKYGKRHGLLDDATPYLREAESIIPEKYGEALSKIVRDQRWEKATFYFEFWGPRSIAGWHADEQHTVTLFDVAPHKKGFVEPGDFLKLCGHLDHAKLIHHGDFTQEIAGAVTNGTLEGMSFEGVVAKGSLDRKTGMPLMFKWKNLAWVEALRKFCRTEEDFERLR